MKPKRTLLQQPDSWERWNKLWKRHQKSSVSNSNPRISSSRQRRAQDENSSFLPRLVSWYRQSLLWSILQRKNESFSVTRFLSILHLDSLYIEKWKCQCDQIQINFAFRELLNSCAVGIWVPDWFSIQMVENSLIEYWTILVHYSDHHLNTAQLFKHRVQSPTTRVSIYRRFSIRYREV